ncbi:MAG: HNH endonuclease [Anaerolineaceae bacterium]|nr:HNH endonuclease [Anaerolineaceae bacterium]
MAKGVPQDVKEAIYSYYGIREAVRTMRKMIKGMPSQLKKRRFCSQACVGLSQRGKRARKVEWVKMNCRCCGKEFEVTPAYVKNGRRKYCSRACHAKANIAGSRKGKDHTEKTRAVMSQKARGRQVMELSAQWKGGRYMSGHGYRYVMVTLLTERQQALARQMTQKKYIQEHRIVAADTEGRPLARDEMVHHRNGNKADNRPENLLVVHRRQHTIKHREVEKRMFILEEENKRLRRELDELKSNTRQYQSDG